jgi:hypothetical protein
VASSDDSFEIASSLRSSQWAYMQFLLFFSFNLNVNYILWTENSALDVAENPEKNGHHAQGKQR